MARFRCWHVVLVAGLGALILTVAILCAAGRCRPSREQQMLVFLHRHSLLPTKYLVHVGRENKAVTSSSSSTSSTTVPPRRPEERAATWLIFDDPLQLDPTQGEHAVQLQQRYALLSLWYHSDSSSDDTAAAAAPDHWLSERHECDWEGVDCTNEVITKLSMCCHHLKGQLPVDLALLTALTSFDVGRNQLTGTVPTEYSSTWPALQEFFVGANNLTGRLPDATSWSMLQIYDVHANQFSSTTVPDTLSSSSLSSSLSSSSLSSSWPASLKNVYLHNNNLTGLVSWCDAPPEQELTLARLVADCDEVTCPCCTSCCPNATDHVCSD